MECFDVAIIGGGLLGSFAARNLMRYDLTAVILEEDEDVCQGISKANTAIIYPGYDNKPESLKAMMSVSANQNFAGLCDELSVEFNRCGSLLVSFGKNANIVLENKLQNGTAAGIEKLKIISGDEARELEPTLSKNIVKALYCSSTGTVNPWKLCYQAVNCAKNNGCELHKNTKLLSIEKDKSKYILRTNRGEYCVKAVINCAGINSDKVHEMLFEPSIRIFPNGADYLVLEKDSYDLSHIIFHEGENGKGITAVPTVEGNILLGPSERELKNEISSTDMSALQWLKETANNVMDGIVRENIIRTFSAIRPNPYRVKLVNGKYVKAGDRIVSFAFERPEETFISLIGIKTPGLTCAEEQGKYVSCEIARALNAKPNDRFKSKVDDTISISKISFENRNSLVKEKNEYGDIVCLCQDVSDEEIVNAIKQGAVSIDGVKRRCGATMGHCQGSRCRYRIAQILSRELDRPELDFLGEEKAI